MGDSDRERLPARPSPTSEFFLNQRSRRRERDILQSSMRIRMENMENNNTFSAQSNSQFSVQDFIDRVERKKEMIRNQRQEKFDDLLKDMEIVVQELRNYYQEFYKHYVYRNRENDLEMRNRIENIIKSMKEVKQEMDSFKVNTIAENEEMSGAGDEKDHKIVYGVSCPEEDQEEYVKTFEALLKALAEIRISKDEHCTISRIDIQKVYENMEKKVENAHKVLSDAKNAYYQLKKVEKGLNYIDETQPI